MTTPAAGTNSTVIPTTPTPAATNAPVVDDFADAFAEATKDEDAPADSTGGVAADVVDDHAVAAAAATDPATAATDDKAPAKPDTATAADPPAEPTELEKAQARITELEAAATAAAAKPAAPVAETKPAPAATPAAATADAPADEAKITWYKPTDEEIAAVTEYEKEWPEQSKAEAIRVKAAAYNVSQYVFAEIAKMYGPKLARFEEISVAMEDLLTTDALRGTHADYNTIRPEMAKWVETLPAYAKAGAKHIMENGTVDEASDLIAEFKKSRPAAAAPAAPAAPAKTELTAAAKKAAGKLSVVDSKRTAPAAAVDPSDFNGAWDEATASG